MNIFENYAAYYDLLYQDKDYNFEVEYLDSLIKKYRPGSNTIFEMGCGTGRHAVFLAKKGYKLHGVDFSKKMVSIANENIEKNKSINDKLSFSYGDIRSVRINKKFDVALSLFHVISYQLTNNDLKNAFLTALHHLNKNGLFIFLGP